MSYLLSSVVDIKLLEIGLAERIVCCLSLFQINTRGCELRRMAVSYVANLNADIKRNASAPPSE